MNRIFSKKTLLQFSLVMAGLFFLSSCLKDTGPVQDFSKSAALVGFQYTGNQAAPFVEAILPNPTDSVALEVTLSVASLTLKSPVTVTLAVDQATLDAYNADTTTSTFPTVFTMLPANQYSLTNITSGVVTINPGQQIVTVEIHLAGDQIDFTKDNALAFKISSVSGATLATNLNSVVFLFSLKNIYDGHYTITADSSSMVDMTNSALTGKYPLDVDLVTEGKTSVALYDISLGGYYHSILNGPSTSYYGGFGVLFNFDPGGSGAVTSVVNFYGQGNNNRSGQLDPTGINQFDFSTRTLRVKYIMLQSGAPRTFFTEVYRYVGSR